MLDFYISYHSNAFTSRYDKIIIMGVFLSGITYLVSRSTGTDYLFHSLSGGLSISPVNIVIPYTIVLDSS